MLQNLEYDNGVKGLNRAAVALSAALVILVVAFVPVSAAQINAAPPSVTSLGFGGRAINGTPPSVTSLGPLGPVFNPAFPNSRPVFSVNPFLPHTGHHHHHPPDGSFVPWGGGVGYYAVPYGYYDQGDQAEDESPDEQYSGGPTVFDRRGSGRVPRPPQTDYANRMPAEPPSVSPQPEAAPAPNQPHTVLVFKDGHQLEVENYAIVGSTLYDLTEGRRHKIPLSDLDLDATTKQNGDRGIDFQVPPGS
jgi:hypothetical protein